MKRTCLLVLCCVIGLTAHGATVDDLFTVRIDVDSQSQAALRRAAAEGLETVLVRVSGVATAGSNVAVAQGLARAERYLSKYRYDSETVEGKVQKYVVLTFVEEQVKGLLSDAGLPMWPSNRPRVLVWLVVDDADGRRFVTRDTHPELAAGLEAEAQRRGLPLGYPLLDIEDGVNLGVDQVWRFDVERVQEAARRYNVNYVLTGRVTALSLGGWMGNWVFLNEGRDQHLDVRRPSLEEVTAPPIDLIADELGQKYAVASNGGQDQIAHIHITGIRDFRDYARAMSYLESISVIRHANPVWIAGEDLVVRLELSSDMEKVQQYLALDSKLVAAQRGDVPGNTVAPVAGISWYYRWLGSHG